MTEDFDSRKKLIEQINQAGRENSTWTVLFHHAVAAQVGLNTTDHKCLDILYNRGAMTAGEMAEITGLTTGAITGVIDRLEKGGFARRVRDPQDRRKVIVEPDADHAAETLGPLFAHLVQGSTALLERFSDEELSTLLRYTTMSTFLLQEQIKWMQGQREITGR